MFSTRPLAGRVLGFIIVIGLAASLGGCASLDGSMPSLIGIEAGDAARQPRLEQVFVVSTRKAESGADSAKASVDGAHYALATLTLPPGHKPGAIEAPVFGAPKPRDHIVLQSNRELDSDEFENELASHISGRVGVNRDVLVFVHGFNTSFDEARLRAAQIAYDSRFGGVTVMFTWASKSEFLGYVSDKDSATVSRDALQELLTTLSETPGVGKIHVLAHSMGGWVAMEALRQEAIAGKRDLGGHLGQVMLASPDIDLDVFSAQMARLRPADVTVFATSKDRALSLSSALAQSRVRVGAIDPGNAEQRAQIEALGAKVYDLSNYSDGFIGHGAYAVTPAVLASIGAGLATPRPEDVNTVSTLDETGYVEKPDN
jgi:esterase/lipase superfamily enzyme